ncbi:hypothetical protein FQN54_008203 [Arachnomyces sp. PD_36]|nr:hypothetical protein FQN54_008203 [Arachnomyces sp. PD_36]
MSKALDAGITRLHGIKNGATKFTGSITEGSRIVPSKTQDRVVPVRVDAGKYNPLTKMLNVVLQVNSKPQSPGLENWLRTHSSHAKLATAQFNTAADDKDAEYRRVLNELTVQGKQNLKDGKKVE